MYAYAFLLVSFLLCLNNQPTNSNSEVQYHTTYYLTVGYDKTPSGIRGLNFQKFRLQMQNWMLFKAFDSWKAEGGWGVEFMVEVIVLFDDVIYGHYM